jgi:hypothetical protein
MIHHFRDIGLGGFVGQVVHVLTAKRGDLCGETGLAGILAVIPKRM